MWTFLDPDPGWLTTEAEQEHSLSVRYIILPQRVWKLPGYNELRNYFQDSRTEFPPIPLDRPCIEIIHAEIPVLVEEVFDTLAEIQNEVFANSYFQMKVLEQTILQKNT